MSRHTVQHLGWDEPRLAAFVGCPLDQIQKGLTYKALVRQGGEGRCHAMPCVKLASMRIPNPFPPECAQQSGGNASLPTADDVYRALRSTDADDYFRVRRARLPWCAKAELPSTLTVVPCSPTPRRSA